MSQHKFTEEQIAAQTRQLQDENVQVADFVRVSAEDFRKALAFFCEKWNFNSVVATNGYCDKAAPYLPLALSCGVENTQTFTLPCINSDQSFNSVYSTKVRAGYLLEGTNAFGKTEKFTENYHNRNGKPIVGPIIAFHQKSACQALEFTRQLAAELKIKISAYSKGPKWKIEDGISLEHEWAQHRAIPWVNYTQVIGELSARFDQSDARSELEAAKAGNTDCNSLEFWVPQELYDELQAARPER